MHFINPLATGCRFGMSEWPLHITLADVFAVDRQGSDIDSKLTHLCKQKAAIIIKAANDSKLGETPVVIFDKSDELFKLHSDIISLLEESRAIFNKPDFTKSGFVPHSTIQDGKRLGIGDRVVIDSISLVDMFPDNNWQQRKVLATLYMGR